MRASERANEVRQLHIHFMFIHVKVVFHLVVRARTQIKIEVADAAQKGHVNDIRFSAF